MPTAGKLFGAIAFLLVGYFAADALKDTLPEQMAPAGFSAISGFLGLLIGWRVMGPNVQHGVLKTAATGVRASFTLAVWGIFAFAVATMIVRSTERRYDGVMEAINGAFVFMLDYGRLLVSSQEALIVLLAGGIAGGLLSGWAEKRWH